VYLRSADRSTEDAYTVLPHARYLDLARWTAAFSHHAAFVDATHGVRSGLAARERPGAGATASFFEFFDARPALGRFFIAGEDSVPAGANVAVLGHAY
jgi:hypothetical protein